MKILWTGFCAKNHSWAIVAQNLCRAFKKLGHQVDMISTNGLQYFPDDLKENLIHWVEEGKIIDFNTFDNNYDMQLSYTSPKNFPFYFTRGNKNRFGIWAYEFSGKNALPNGFAKQYRHIDKILAPSQFVKQIFMDSGVPDNVLEVIPHGIDLEKFNTMSPYKLKTKKKIKILINYGQPHLRKNIEGNLNAFGKAFNKNNDVCLIIKGVDKLVERPFEVSFKELFNSFKKKFPNHADVEIIRDFVPEIESLYKACDIHLHLSKGEGFSMTALEALGAGIIPIFSRWSGQLDFLNDDNAILVDGKITNAPPKALYWDQKTGTKWFEPNIDEAAEKLKYCVNNYAVIKEKSINSFSKFKNNYDWLRIATRVLDLYQ